MFKEIFFPLVTVFSPFNIFQYITFRAAYAAVTSLLIAFIFGPKIIEILQKLNARQSIRTDGPQTHLTKAGTPTMGGVMIILSIVISLLLWQDIRNKYTWILLFCTLGYGAVGFLDDILKVLYKNSHGISAIVKLLGQFAVATAVAVYLYIDQNPYTTQLYIPMFKDPVLDLGWMWIPFAVLLQVGFSNAVNLTDGLDGLATGLVIMAGIAFAVLSYLSGRVDFSAHLLIPYLPGVGELSILSFAIVGAAIGFLWFNSHPAEVMMGDTGSLALGGILSVLSLIVKREVLLLIIGGVFVMEAASVIIQVVYYKWKGKRVFLMAPLHHHFELKGWPEIKVVVRFWILGGLFLILSLSTLKIQ